MTDRAGPDDPSSVIFDQTDADDPRRVTAVTATSEAYVQFLEQVGDIAADVGLDGYVILTVAPEGVRLAAWADGEDNMLMINELAHLISRFLETVRLLREDAAGHA